MSIASMASKPAEPVAHVVWYSVQFSVAHELTVIAVEQQRDAHVFPDKTKIYPDDWRMEKSCRMGSQSWVQFDSDDPFKPEDLELVRLNLQEIDNACVVISKRRAP